METKKIRVLVVDDKEEARYLLETLLRGAGHEVASAQNGAEALDKLHAQNFDIIVADILMPVMDGFQLCLHVKQDNKLRSIPLVFYTATYIDEADEDLAMMMGAHVFIRKPQEPKEFTRIISEIVTEIREGKLRPRRPSLGRPEDLLQRYNERVVSKLHDKMAQLEKEIAERKKVEEELLDSQRLLGLRDKIARIFLTVPDDQMYAAVLEVVLEVMESEYGVFGYVDDDGAWVCPSMTRDVWDQCRIPDKDIVFPREKWGGIWGRALREKRTVCSNALLVVPEGHVPVARAISVPIMYQDAAIGGFVVANKKTDYDARDQNLLETIAKYVAPVLHSRLIRERQDRERCRVEEALRVETERFQMLAENAPFGMVMIGKDGTFKYVNRKFEELFGYDLSDVPNGREWFRKAYPDPEYRHKVISTWIEDLKAHAPGEARPRVFAVTCKDGTQKIIDFRAVKLGTGEDLVTFEDITARMKAEKQLVQSEQKYRLLFENSMDAVTLTSRDGKLIDVNQSFLNLFGCTREEAAEIAIPDLYVNPADRGKFIKDIDSTGSVRDYELNLRKKDGTPMECLVTSLLRGAEDGTVVYHSIIRDVTERKALERQLLQSQKMEAIGTLAGGIAHDFNNLLTVVLGFSDLLLVETDERDPSYADIQKINQAARSGADLVKRILAFSKKAETYPRPLDLNSEIEQIKELLIRTIPKMIEIKLMLSDDLATVNADPTQVEQVLMNLAVNARDAMPGGGKLTIETQNVSLDEEYRRMHLGARPGDYVMLSVSDTGHGMDREALNRIFEPFYTTKGTGKGTGLGLAVVYGIVKQHGGYINCYSEPGVGTTFKIYLPVIQIEAESKTALDKATLAGGTETVLLVDDEESIRDLGKRILERSGYTVLTAGNAKEALGIYTKDRDKISLVILDLIMPEMGGKQCLEELLRINPQAKVLIATGLAANGLTREAIDMGGKGLVGKPYNVEEMLRAVRKVLDGD